MAVLVAIELSKTTWLLAIYDPISSKVSRRQGGGEGGDADGLIGILRRCQRDVQAHTEAAVGIECVFEAPTRPRMTAASGCPAHWSRIRSTSCASCCRWAGPGRGRPVMWREVLETWD